MKSKFIIGTTLVGILLNASPVEAMGNAKVTFSSNNNIKVGETFTVTMNVSDIEDTYDGIVSMGGNLSFDSSKLEYISSKEVDAPYQFQINTAANYKMAGLDMTLENGILDTTTVYEFTFKALEHGNTSITFENAKLTDSQDYISVSVISKNITIEKEEISVVKVETPIEKETIIIKQATNNEKQKIEKNEEKIVDIQEITNEPSKIEQKKIDVEVKTIIKEKQTFMKKVQKLFNNFITQFKNFFK